METALNLVPETTEVETRALSVVEQASAVVIIDGYTYMKAGDLWKIIGDMINEVKDTFDPICDAANKAHKAATAKRSKYLDPLTAVHKSVKGLMSTYEQEQERIRLAEQKRLEEIARKEEEDRILQEAIEAEEEAKANGATPQEAAQEAEAILQEPVSVPPVVLPKETPKIAGLSFRTIWDFTITNEKLVPRDYLMIDSVKVRGVASSLKGQTNIPGIKVFSRRV